MRTEAARLAEGLGDAAALAQGGLAIGYLGGDLDAGTVFIDRALMLNPNLAQAWFHGAWLSINLGEPEKAIRYFEHVIRLSPVEPFMPSIRGGIAFAHFIIGDDDKACSLAEQLLREKPDYHAEQREPYESRGSRTVLGEPGGESPPGHSTKQRIKSPPASSQRFSCSESEPEKVKRLV